MSALAWTLAAALGLAIVPGEAQDPRLINGGLDRHAVSGTLAREFDAAVRRVTEPAWIGYAVPMTPGDRTMCDWSDSVRTTASSAPVHLEPADTFFVFYRVEQGQVVRIRSYSVDCPLDAGGKAVQWLTGVRSAESVALLEGFVATGSSRVAEGAMSALALHDGAEALDALIGYARDGPTSKLRGNALFWLSQRAGQKAVGAIDEAIARDPDTDVKKRAVFALSQLPRDEGVPRLIDLARTNKNPVVRKQAMFWLGQSKDPRALQFFQEILKY